MRSRMLPLVLAVVASALIIVGIIYNQKQSNHPTGVDTLASAVPAAAGSPLPTASASPAPSPDAVAVTGIQKEQKVSNPSPDLTVDANGLSKATVVLNTTQGVIKYKFYSKDAPNTVKRQIEL